jgi:hypothetical protein
MPITIADMLAIAKPASTRVPLLTAALTHCPLFVSDVPVLPEIQSIHTNITFEGGGRREDETNPILESPSQATRRIKGTMNLS